MKNILHSRVTAVVAGASVLAVLGAGTAFAAGKITGADIKNGTVTSADVKNKSLKKKDLARSTVKQLKGKRGPAGEQGPAGEAGPAGPAGEPGAPGQTLVAYATTAANDAYGGVNVVDVTSVAAGSGGPAADGGAALVEPVELEAGTYVIDSTVQFFDFQPTADGNDVDYGVARLFLGGESVGTAWTGQVPDDGNNAAQASATLVVEVPEGGATLSARAVLRGGDDGQAGGNLIVSRVQTEGSEPTDPPTETPTESPTESPTETPTESPTESPTETPTTPAG